MSRSPSPAPLSKTIDRQTTTPFLLHFCYRSNAFHNLVDFPLPSPSHPRPALPAHLQIYTWYSCTLRELAHLLTTALPSVVSDPAIGTRLSFRLVYPDTSPASRAGRLGRLEEEGRGRYTTREMGSIVITAPDTSHSNGNGNVDEASSAEWELGGDDAEKTLADLRFVIGDFIDCAIFPPLPDGSVVPRGNTIGNRGGYINGRGRGTGNYGLGRGNGAPVPIGEWRRGERLPGAEGRGGFRSERGGGGYRGGRGRPY